MKRIRFIYGAMLLVLALAMNACDDYYSVAVAGDPGVTPVVLTTPGREYYASRQGCSGGGGDCNQYGELHDFYCCAR